jgi:multidrug efflux pump subunit AcrA (membrane-fusion protein)
MTRRRTIVIGTILVIAALAAVAFYVTRSRSQAAAAAQYETIEAEQGDLTSLIGATGTVRANQTGILSWQTSGTVGEVTAKVGDLVMRDRQVAQPAMAQNIILAGQTWWAREPGRSSCQTAQAQRHCPLRRRAGRHPDDARQLQLQAGHPGERRKRAGEPGARPRQDG